MQKKEEERNKEKSTLNLMTNSPKDEVEKNTICSNTNMQRICAKDFEKKFDSIASALYRYISVFTHDAVARTPSSRTQKEKSEHNIAYTIQGRQSASLSFAI